MQVHIPLAIICVVLCLLPFNDNFRRNWILPICVILITVYMAIRYDYGLDFWSYYRGFTKGETRTEYTEPFFLLFTSLFAKYYQLVAAISVAIMVTIYFWVKRFIPEKKYWLYFLCFMCMPGMSFTMMTALRTVMAFVVLSWGLYKYYIQKYNPMGFIITVVVAGLFHNSAFIFVFLPLLYTIVLRINSYVFFYLFILFSVFSFTGITQDISTFLFGTLQHVSIIDADHYDVYATKYISNINGAIGRLPLIFPSFFICKYANIYKDSKYQRFYVLSILYFSIFYLSLDLEYRFTLYLFTFVIIALGMCLDNMKLTHRLISIIPLIIYDVYQLYAYFIIMREEQFGVYSEGNFFIYETIFDNLPLI